MSQQQEKDEFTLKIRQMFRAAGLISATVSGSAIFFYFGSEEDHTLLECLYMSVITVSTVGFREVVVINTPLLQIVTMLLIVLGTGGLIYFGSILTAFIIEGDINNWLKRRSMRRKINSLRQHVIVCGVGSTGANAAIELYHSGESFVMIDIAPSKFSALEKSLKADLHWIIGDAEDDNTLERAGIRHAKAIIFALPSDRNNLFGVVTARKFNPDLLIVSRVIEDSSAIKLQRAGANEIVSPNMLGGRRMAFEVLRPQATGFLELIMTEEEKVMRIEEVTVRSTSKLVGLNLAQAKLRRHGDILVIGVREPDTGINHYAPGPKFKIKAGMVLIIFGEMQDIQSIAARADSYG